MEAVGLDPEGWNPGGGLHFRGGEAKEWGDIIGGGYCSGPGGATHRVDGVEWGFGTGVVVPKVEHSAFDSFDRA